MRASSGASGPRSSKWHDSPAQRAGWENDPRRDEPTLGLEDEWDDVPTAELHFSAPDDATSNIPPPQPAREPRLAPIVRHSSTPRARDPEQPSQQTLRAEHPRKHVVAQPAGVTPSVDPQREAPPKPAANTPAPSRPRDITPGTLLCNRYLLGRLLGTGGSSLIFQAEDRRRIGAQDFGSRIAIKVLRPEMRHNGHALTRLRREFRQMQRLSHPGIARVFELARDEDVWFMTMELIEGQTINQWLKAGTSSTASLQIIGACCEALAHAHAAGVVHGDLKPSNVLVLPGGGVKLVDFGSAAERDAATGEVDKERSFAATPPYASPQVLAGEVADPRDDVFSLACLTYAVLTNGEHPFGRKSSAEAQQAQLRPRYSKTIHPRQFDVMVRALSWDREQRPLSVREFMNALLASDWRRDSNPRETSIDVSPSVPAPPPAPQPAPTTATAAPPEPIAQPAASEPAPAVKPDDIARLKAAVAAAEAHAERIEPAAPVEKPKANPGDPLERFRGYVAGPMAPQDDIADTALAEQRPPEPQVATRSKRRWPWQRTTLLVLAIAGSVGLLATQFDLDAEPIQQASARTTTPQPEVAPSAPAEVVPATAVTPNPEVEEKKSASVAVKTTPQPAPGEVSFSTRTLRVGAGQTMAALTVTRERSTRGRARVAWTIEGGTAQRGVHYEMSNPQIIEFLDGQSVRSLFIPLTPEKDTQNARHSKTFTVKLQQASGGPALGAIKQVYVTIVGDVTDEADEKVVDG